MKQQIQNRLQEIRNLGANWDDDGALPANPVALKAAEEILYELLYSNTALPEIGLCADGTIDLWWERDWTLLANITEENVEFFWYEGRWP